MSNPLDAFRGFLVCKVGERVATEIAARPLRELPPGEVLLDVRLSSLNYKDALAAEGHPGIVRKFPHIPGIDAVGVVLESQSPQFRSGDWVLATGHELGVERWGGWASRLRAPAEWLVPLPAGLSPEEAMALGTAGFTAAQCVLALQRHDITPERGDVVVTGATGGVGVLAVRLLSRLGYRVAAVSGKPDRRDWLLSQGAQRVIAREAFLDQPDKPLLNGLWAGGVDTVGGELLATLLRSTAHRGCVAACGMAGGVNLPLTVYPFILRGVALAGIDSAWCPDGPRRDVWRLLAGEWKLPGLLDLTTTIGLAEIPAAVRAMRAGESAGRVLVDPSR